MPKVSVLMGTFNRQTLMRSSIASILDQTYKDFTFLICDDGSTDNTWKALKVYAKKDPRISLLRNKLNKGVPYTMNRLLDACKTEYACWMGSDDVSNIYRLELQLKALQKEKKMIATGGVWFSERKQINHREEPRRDNKGRVIKFVTGSLLFPVDKKIRFPENTSWFGTDAAWYLKMTKEYKTYTLDQVLYYVRSHIERIGVAKRGYKQLPPDVRKGMSFVDTLEYMKGQR